MCLLTVQTPIIINGIYMGQKKLALVKETTYLLHAVGNMKPFNFQFSWDQNMFITFFLPKQIGKMTVFFLAPNKLQLPIGLRKIIL